MVWQLPAGRVVVMHKNDASNFLEFEYYPLCSFFFWGCCCCYKEFEAFYLGAATVERPRKKVAHSPLGSSEGNRRLLASDHRERASLPPARGPSVAAVLSAPVQDGALPINITNIFMYLMLGDPSAQKRTPGPPPGAHPSWQVRSSELRIG